MGDSTLTLRQLHWDFSIVSSLNFTLILLLVLRISHTAFQSATKRNRLTFRIMCWFTVNQVVIYAKLLAQVIMETYEGSKNEDLGYGLDSLQAMVFVIGVFYQLLEWHACAALIKFQSERHAKLLDVQKPDFQAYEMKIWRRLSFATWSIALYHTTKVTVAGIILTNCVEDCENKRFYTIRTICYTDCVLVMLIYVYFLYVVAFYLRQIYARCRFEYYKHRTCVLLTACTMFLVFPVDVINFFYLQGNLSDETERISYFLTYIAHSLPSVLLVCFKPNEDCFNCFNRCTPKRYSVFQFSADDLLGRLLEEDEHEEINRRSLKTTVNSFSNSNVGPALFFSTDSDQGFKYTSTEICATTSRGSGALQFDALSEENLHRRTLGRPEIYSEALVEHMIADNDEVYLNTTSPQDDTIVTDDIDEEDDP